MPNLCAADGKSATDLCVFNPTAVNVTNLIEQVNGLAARDLIDPVDNVKGDKVFIYHGTKDTAILPCIFIRYFRKQKSIFSHSTKISFKESGKNVETMYTYYGADIETEFTIPAPHGFVWTINLAPVGRKHLFLFESISANKGKNRI